MGSRNYKSFAINVQVIQGLSGGYVGSVTLTHGGGHIRDRRFTLPLDEDLASEEDVLREALQYGVDLVDGLLPWFDPQSSRPC